MEELDVDEVGEGVDEGEEDHRRNHNGWQDEEEGDDGMSDYVPSNTGGDDDRDGV